MQRARHHGVYVLVQEVVDGIGAAGCQRASHTHQGQGLKRRDALRGQEHAADGSDEEQANDRRLGERQVVVGQAHDAARFFNRRLSRIHSFSHWARRSNGRQGWRKSTR